MRLPTGGSGQQSGSGGRSDDPTRVCAVITDWCRHPWAPGPRSGGSGLLTGAPALSQAFPGGAAIGQVCRERDGTIALPRVMPCAQPVLAWIGVGVGEAGSNRASHSLIADLDPARPARGYSPIPCRGRRLPRGTRRLASAGGSPALVALVALRSDRPTAPCCRVSESRRGRGRGCSRLPASASGRGLARDGNAVALRDAATTHGATERLVRSTETTT